MAIEDIINRLQAPQIMTPFQLQAGADELQQNKLMNVARQRALEEQRRQQEVRALTDRLYSQNYNNPEQFRKAAAQAGIGSVIPEYDQQQREIQKEQRLQESAKLEEAVKRGEYIASRVRSATPENWEQTVSGIEQDMGHPIPKLHFQYDPQKVDAIMQEGLSNTEAIKMKLDAYKQGFEEQKFGYQQQKDAQQMDIQQQRADDQQQWQQRNYDQRDRAIDATAINKQAPLQIKADNSRETDDLINQAMPLIGSSTGSYIGAGADKLNQAFGVSDKGATSLAKLKVIGAAIVAKMPRAPGAQSDAELALAQEQVGKLGDATVPPAAKEAALQTLQEINARQIERAKQAGLIMPNDHAQQGTPAGIGSGVTGGWDDAPEDWSAEEEAAYQRTLRGR